MIDWLFNIKPKPAPVKASKTETASMKIEDVLPKNPPGRTHVVAVEKAKDKDELVTVLTKDGKTIQLIRHRKYDYTSSADWYSYPEFIKVDILDESRWQNLYEEFKLKQKYEADPPLTVTAKVQASLRCVYCHSVMSDKAQACLRCGTFLCLECSPTLEKCPTPGCSKEV